MGNTLWRTQKLLNRAAIVGDLGWLQQLVEQDANADKEEALRYAAERGHLDVVRYLVEFCGANVDGEDKRGRTALVLAANRGQVTIVRYLLQQGGTSGAKNYVDSRDLPLTNSPGCFGAVLYLVRHHDTYPDENAALLLAIERGYGDVVRYLIEQCGTNANIKTPNGDSALIVAAQLGHSDIVRHLTKPCGADANTKNERGDTALTLAARSGNLELVRYLVEECGADPNADNNDGNTALLLAVKQAHTEVIRYLVEKCDADADAANIDGDTALILAASLGHSAVVGYLLQQCDPDANAKNVHGDSALISAAKWGHVQVIQCLFRNCDVDACHVDALQRLRVKLNLSRMSARVATQMEAIPSGNGVTVQYIASQCGAGFDRNGVCGTAALVNAAECNRINFVQYLTEHWGVDVDIKDSRGNTAFIVAAEKGRIDAMKYLAEYCCADVNAKNNAGETALIKAARNGRIDVVEYLIDECGATVKARSNDGCSAVQLTSCWDIGWKLKFYHLQGMTEAVAQASPGSSHNFIPPSEIALVLLNQNGHMGDFRAKWLDADVAVKPYTPGVTHMSFEDEVHQWQRLRHPNVTRTYGACEAKSNLKFFVTEHASKGSLQILSQSITRATQPIWKYLYDATLGLEYLHARGVIHGDLCCRNILIGDDGMAKLSHFGWRGSNETSNQALPNSVGPMRWQSPEALTGKQLSYESDVYSMGMCVLEAVTGNMPWWDEVDWQIKYCKLEWAPEMGADAENEPNCPHGSVRDIVWHMCSRDPGQRANLSSVVQILDRLATKESANAQIQYATAAYLSEGGNENLDEQWTNLCAFMKSTNSVQHRQVYDGLQKARELLQNSNHSPALFARFQALLFEFSRMVKTSPEQTRIMRLSLTCAPTNSIYAFQQRIKSLLSSLGESGDSVADDQELWQQQPSQHIELFVSGVSDTFLLLQDLKSPEERSAFLRTLTIEMENSVGKYTPAQLKVLRRAYEQIASKLDTEDLAELTPQWFIPWYELIVDEWSCIGEGGFGSVHRAKWLDSDVVVKRVTLAGSNGSTNASTSLSSLSLSAIPPITQSQAQMNANQRVEALSGFRREVDIWFGLSHPHVVRLFGACHVGRPFFVCEFAPNGTLMSFLRKHPGELWAKLHEAALGVQYLHARDVVHGDLKGNNVVIGSDMKAKVTDFGLSAVSSSDTDVLVSGAWNWVAPECLQDSSRRPTFASDIYSLGMCIVEALRVVGAVKSGQEARHCLPWLVADRAAVKYHATHGSLPSRPLHCEDDEWALVSRMCSLEPRKRVKISTVVDELARLATANTSPLSNDVATSSFDSEEWSRALKTILASPEYLAKLQDYEVVLLYTSLWIRLHDVFVTIDQDPRVDMLRTFCVLVNDTNEATLSGFKGEGFISLAETTMRSYALHRRLDKFCEAYSLDHGNRGNV